MATHPITSWQIEGEKWKQWQILFSWAPKSLWMLSAAMISKDACSLEGKLTNLDSVLKSRDITLPTKVCIVKVMVFPVVMYRCENWTIKKAECQRIYALNRGAREDFLKSPLDSKEIKIVNPKGNQP